MSKKTSKHFYSYIHLSPGPSLIGIMTRNFNMQRLQMMSDFSNISILNKTLCSGVKEKVNLWGHCDKTAMALLMSGLIFS